MQGERMIGNDNVHRKNTGNRQCTQKNTLGFVHAKWENARKSSMQDAKMLGNHQYKVGKCSELSMQGERMLGIIDVHRKILKIVNERCKNAGKGQSMLKNARNRQCKVKEYWETTKYTERMLGNDNTRCKNAGK